MHDLKALRRDPEAFATQMARRNIDTSVIDKLMAADVVTRAAEGALGDANAAIRRNAEAFGKAKRQGVTTDVLADDGRRLGEDAAACEERARETKAVRDTIVLALPNALRDDVPVGADEHDNIVQFTSVGDPEHMPQAVPQRPHWESGPAFGMDMEAGTLLGGSRTTVLRGPLARLERVLGQWMLELHVNEHGYEEVSVPHLVRDEIMQGTGQLPKFEDDLFRAGERWLIPTAEVPLTNLARIWHTQLHPMRLVALTPCYRAEAGKAGRDTRGMLRQHQFNKVEMVSVVPAAEAADEHARMTGCAERVLTLLGLTWRRVLLCAGDTGFSASITYDLEVWMAGTGEWREISSVSDCGTFQARRMGLKGVLPHTLNGSGVAVGRALVALLENYVDAEGVLRLPRPLWDRMGTQEMRPRLTIA